MNKTEILTPAGSFESLIAGINASCDALYIGGTKFGARAFAENFDEKTLCKAIDYAHVHGKKIYLTINTLLKNNELEKELFQYLHPYYVHGIDAVIIQDMGVLNFIHEYFPQLPIHASTQMSITQASGAEVLKEFGITRLVNARELNVREISELRQKTDLEIESFVHGALCYCYSGQCLMSSMIGGRSGNRGRCAQPCRMPYEFNIDGKMAVNQNEKYLLSPKDMSALSLIPKLIEAGIDSFKIEGRMKRPEYAAGVTYIYRKYVDRYHEFGAEGYEKLLRDNKKDAALDEEILMDLYNRGGFSKGYYEVRNSKSMITLTRPNHSGVLVGTIKEVKGNQALISLTNKINAQDILEIRDDINNLYEFTVKTGEISGKTITTNFNRGLKIKPGNLVYRTKNNELLNSLGVKYLNNQVKEPVEGALKLVTGEPMELTLSSGDQSVRLSGEIVSEAMNQPLSEEKIRKQMTKTNDTAFYFKELNLKIEGRVFVPIQKINELRRDGITALEEKISESYKREQVAFRQNALVAKDKITLPQGFTGISTLVNQLAQLNGVLRYSEVTDIYIESDMVPFQELLHYTTQVKKAGKKCFIAMPHIFRASSANLFHKYKEILTDNTIDGFLIRNYEEYYFLAKEVGLADKELISDYHLYVFNQRAGEFFRKLGIKRITAPLELNYNELKDMAGSFHEILVYGYLPLMVSAQCLYKTSAGGDNKVYNKENGNPCCYAEAKGGELIDRFSKKFKVKRHCRECYNIIYNSQGFSLLSNYTEVNTLGLERIRLDFTYETEEDTRQVVQNFADRYIYEKHIEIDEKDYTRGHFKRGVD
ncbi:MAG: peptidase [Anaerocolumna sp.]|jgi:putative protease|nr:peptidase [Anaerocolumna sp.]